MTAHIQLSIQNEQQPVVEGFISFVHVDADGHPLSHGAKVIAETEEDMQLQKRARALPRR